MNIKLKEIKITCLHKPKGIYVRKDAAEFYMWVCAGLGGFFGFLVGWLIYA